jgi:hypothetical protein
MCSYHFDASLLDLETNARVSRDRYGFELRIDRARSGAPRTGDRAEAA